MAKRGEADNIQSVLIPSIALVARLHIVLVASQSRECGTACLARDTMRLGIAADRLEAAIRAAHREALHHRLYPRYSPVRWQTNRPTVNGG
jgi:hypothetical protein